jgi:hypothetical protein
VLALEVAEAGFQIFFFVVHVVYPVFQGTKLVLDKGLKRVIR